MIRPSRAAGAALLLAFGICAVAGPSAGATVPPRNCGIMIVESKRYQIKADRMRCTTAKTYSRRYLSSHSRPSGYRCSDFAGSTKLKFRCAKGVRVFFAIKR
jgi:hypothetical protein